MNKSNNSAWCEGAPRDRANSRRMMLWSIGWAVAILIAAAFGEMERFDGGSVAFIAAGLSAILGAGTVGAYRVFLKETDELRQKIELESLAVAFGVGVVGGMAYSQILRALDLGEPHLAYVIAAMLIVRSIGVGVGLRRYS
jgi:drug/metabolite transporter (DMT)-like permease